MSASGFLVGAAAAAHWVEGGNIHRDFWVLEDLKHSDIAGPSDMEADHHHR